MITVKAANGSSATVAEEATARQTLAALEFGAGEGDEAIVAAAVDGEPTDLDARVGDGAVCEPVRAGSDQGRAILRHSTAHVLAQAVTDLFADAKFAIGPPVADGFYYDFDVARAFTPEDLEAIEARMREIVAAGQPFQHQQLAPDEALERFADQPYKRELIETAAGAGPEAEAAGEGVGAQTVSIYQNPRSDGSVWPDLCLGPHVPATDAIPAFALQRVAGAYWRGDENNRMLQRIYGTAWESQDALQTHLDRLQEARRRDHRVLGRELDLLSFPEELGPGLAVWHPKGATVRRAMEDYARDTHAARGYEPVFTPHLGRAELWQTSGHLGFFADSMYPPVSIDAADKGGDSPNETGDGEATGAATLAETVDYYPKPMNCPFHILIYRSRTRSYRELPLRLFELGTVYRYERSGTVHGLLRARGFTQDDSHLFTTPEQVEGEIADVIDFTLALYRDFGFTDGPSRVALSTRPAKATTVGSDESWSHAEDALAKGLEASGLPYVVDEGEGAFYGPKVDLQITDALGRAWQLTTIQLDFNMPERFDLTYTGADGVEHRPIMIHRALYGSLDRFFAILLEHYGGAFPAWLAPVQAVVVPIADRHHDYARHVIQTLTARGLRAELDDSDDTMGAKIRKHQLAKVCYQLIVGDREAEAGTVAVRPRAGEQRKGVDAETFAAELADEVAARRVA
jgi:threonyl-tRNA synthetase